MIELQNVSKYFPTPHGRKYALRDVSLSLPEKANVGVLGLNGAGKSTLLGLIGGIDFPNEGKIKLEGSISWPLGLSGGVQGSLTGKENAVFVCRVYGDDASAIKEKLEYILAFSELGDYFDMPVKSYSSGMRSRLLFAISMAFDFDIYLIEHQISFHLLSQNMLMSMSYSYLTIEYKNYYLSHNDILYSSYFELSCFLYDHV